MVKQETRTIKTLIFNTLKVENIKMINRNDTIWIFIYCPVTASGQYSYPQANTTILRAVIWKHPSNNIILSFWRLINAQRMILVMRASHKCNSKYIWCARKWPLCNLRTTQAVTIRAGWSRSLPAKQKQWILFSSRNGKKSFLLE